MTFDRRSPPHVVIAESSARLRTLIDPMFSRYASQGNRPDARGGLGTLVLPPSTGEVLRCVRYLAVELDDFAGMCARNFPEIAGGLGEGRLCALHAIIGDQADTARLVRDLRAALADAPGLTLEELGSRVSPDQLERILLYARLVIEFQDRLTGGSMGEGGFTREEWRKILDVSVPRSPDQANATRRECAEGVAAPDMGRHLRACSIMYERWEGMQMVDKMLDDCVIKFNADPNFKTLTLTWASYMIKYLVMDLVDFARQHATLGMGSLAGFAQNCKKYEAAYGKYFMEEGGREGKGAARLVRDELALLTMARNDVIGGGNFIDHIRKEFARAYSIPDSPRYDPNLAGISQKFERARAGAGDAGLGTEAAMDGIAGVFGRPGG